MSATTTSTAKTGALRRADATPYVVDLLDRDAVSRAVAEASPDVIVQQATALSAMGDNMRRFDRYFERTNRLRTDGTRHLIEAGAKAGTRRLVVQSFGGWPYARTGTWIKSEHDPVDAQSPRSFSRTLAALLETESAVLGSDIEGVVLRYGFFYGPGTSLGEDGTNVAVVRVLAGEAAVSVMTRNRGASNARAKRDLDWEPRWPTWRVGFREGISIRRPDSRVVAATSALRRSASA